MILLLGGTAETGPLAQKLLSLGYAVLVSTVTDTPLNIPSHPQIHRRVGALDASAMAALISTRSICGIIDATHPYAETAHTHALVAATKTGVPHVVYLRAPSIRKGTNIRFCDDHNEAAQRAFDFGKPVLTTIGSNGLSHYAAASRTTGIPLFARILNRDAFIEKCVSMGISSSHLITGRGPFSHAENVDIITRHHIGVLVIKDGGEAAWTHARITAANGTGCHVIVIRRPKIDAPVWFDDMMALMQYVQDNFPADESLPVHAVLTR